MKLTRLTSRLIGLLLLVGSSLLLAQNDAHSTINLKSCKLEIRADQISYHENSISFSGNVEFLYGLANVKTNSVILIKKKDGSCHLVANPWHGKIDQ